MTVYDLNREQLIELKQAYLTQQYDERGESPSWGELASADEIISDDEIYEAYAGTDFVNDDFFCSAGQDDIEENKFIIADRNFFLHAVSSIEYQWSDWAADTFTKRGAIDALEWAHKNGYPGAKAISIFD